MKQTLTFLFSLFFLNYLSAQTASSFKCGWTSYKTTCIIHEYTYSYAFKDSVKLYLADSTKTFIAPDSEAVLTVDYPFHDNTVYKIANYFNAKRKLVKTEEYKDNLVQVQREFKYDEKNRKIFSLEENKVNNNAYKKTFDYSSDKATGDNIVTESSYFNDRIEFYTKAYFDKNGVKYKEVRLNDNNKDVIHVESFFYNDAGRLKERTVYFKEFNVTKTFPESGGDNPVKCFRSFPINIPEKPTLQTKVTFLRKLLQKNQVMLLDKDCNDFEYKFSNADCEVIISTTKTNNIKKIVFRLKEKTGK